jgi:hypothetical protein
LARPGNHQQFRESAGTAGTVGRYRSRHDSDNDPNVFGKNANTPSGCNATYTGRLAKRPSLRAHAMAAVPGGYSPASELLHGGQFTEVERRLKPRE